MAANLEAPAAFISSTKDEPRRCDIPEFDEPFKPGKSAIIPSPMLKGWGEEILAMSSGNLDNDPEENFPIAWPPDGLCVGM